MQTLIVGIIIVIAAAYVIRRFYRSVKRTESTACGCDCNNGCSQTDTCKEPSVK